MERNYVVLKYRDPRDITAGFDFIGTIQADRGESAVDAAVRRENYRLGEVQEQSGMFVPVAESNFIPIETAVTQEVSVQTQAKPLVTKKEPTPA